MRLTVPTENSTVGAGDVFTVEIVGEKDLPVEYEVASDGTVDFAYVHRLHVDGLEPQEIAELIRRRLVEDKILTNPSVNVRVREYNSKHVTVLGQVVKPGSFPFVVGMSLIQAVSLAGGFNSIANRDKVNLTRRSKGRTEAAIVSIDAIMEGRSPDIPLQAGDQIYIPERVF